MENFGMNNLISTIQYFLIITAELTVLFLGISTIVALVLTYIPQEKLRQWLSRRGIWGNFLGAVVGSLTPFCACSTIPMTLGMLNAGAPFGPVMSFVIASPLLNPIIISMVWALMGKRQLKHIFFLFSRYVMIGLPAINKEYTHDETDQPARKTAAKPASLAGACKGTATKRPEPGRVLQAA